MVPILPKNDQKDYVGVYSKFLGLMLWKMNGK